MESFVLPPQFSDAYENLEVVTLRHGEVEFQVLRAVEPGILLTDQEVDALRHDQGRTAAIAQQLLWLFGGAIVINQAVQAVESWDTVKTLLLNERITFDSMGIDFQEARVEPVLFLNHQVGSGIVPPIWTVRFKKFSEVPGGQVLEPIDCWIKVWCAPGVVKLSPEFSRPFGHDSIEGGWLNL